MFGSPLGIYPKQIGCYCGCVRYCAANLQNGALNEGKSEPLGDQVFRTCANTLDRAIMVKLSFDSTMILVITFVNISTTTIVIVTLRLV